MFKRRYNLIVILIVFGIALIAGRIYLSYWVQEYVNDKIAALENYSGSIRDIDIFLWRGAYQIHDLKIYKSEGGLERPFVAVENIDLSVEWRSLFNGAIVAEIEIYEVDLYFSRNQTGGGAGWVKFVNTLSPLEINYLAIHGGRLSYIDYTVNPNIDIYINDIAAEITNLRNVKDKEHPLPSNLKITGSSIGDGRLLLHGQMNILKDVPDFDLGMELTEANLTALNDYARAFANIDFESGEIGIFSELAAVDGAVVGYIKPVATNISLAKIDQDSNPFSAIWELMVSFFVELFKNQPADQFAMRIPLEGDIDNPDSDTWSAFISIFRNAFVEAFSKNEDGTINFEDALEEK